MVERSSQASGFSEDDDRVLSDLARQVGLALHNSQLDTALQTTLDEVRKQADELPASRGRASWRAVTPNVVASSATCMTAPNSTSSPSR